MSWYSALLNANTAGDAAQTGGGTTSAPAPAPAASFAAATSAPAAFSPNATIDWSTGFPRVMRGRWNQDENGNQFWEQYDDQATIADLKAAGLWKNVGDPANSPLFSLDKFSPEGRELLSRFNVEGPGINDPYDYEQTHNYGQYLWDMLGVHGSPNLTQEMVDELMSAGLSREQLQALQDRLTVMDQSLEDMDWEDYAGAGLEFGLNLGVGGMLGAGFGALGGSIGGALGGAPGASIGTTAGKLGAGAALNGGDLGAAAKNFLVGQGLDVGAGALGDAFDSAFSSAPPLDGAWDPDALDYSLGIEANTPAWARSGPNLSGAASVINADGSSTLVTPAAPVFPKASDLWTRDAFEEGMRPGMLAGTAADYDWTQNMTGEGTTSGQRLQSDPNLSFEPTATAAPAQEAPQQTTAELLQKYAKVAKTVTDLLGADKPPSAPQRQEGQSDAEYSQDLVTYLGLDAETMAAAGLTPGTPEYYDYIMAQADTIIAQVLDGIDVDAADLAEQLRNKTAEELEALQRALYVRGQMDQFMGAGTYTDPFTGEAQEVIGDGQFNPNVAAYQRGLAGDVDELAGLEGDEALSKIQGMLGRDADLFGMQERADQRFEQAKRNQYEDPRKRRGMLY